MRRLILGVAVVALIVGAAALGFAAGGHATSNQLVPCPYMCHVNANGTRDIELHPGRSSDRRQSQGLLRLRYGRSPSSTPISAASGQGRKATTRSLGLAGRGER